MPKQRISSVDIRHLVSELKQSCVGLRLANLYDVTPKIYMLKFARPEHKEFVIVESGVRIHSTSFARAKPTLPSAFTLKLRKHLRTWRLENVEQLGIDRVIDFTFGREENAFHLIFEFYAKGNIILTDHEYTIIALLRTHRQDEESLYAVREHYPVEKAAQHEPMTEARLLGLLEAPSTPIKQLLNAKTEYGPAQIDHCLLEAEIKPNTKLVQGFTASHPEAVQHLLAAFKKIDDILAAPSSPVGYVYKRKSEVPRKPEDTSNGPDAEEAALYEHFSAFPLLQYGGNAFDMMEFPSFNAAVDHYFSKFEDQRAVQDVENKQQEKLSKVEKVKKDHEERIKELKRVQEKSEHKANLIIVNAQEVEAAIAVIRSALAQSVDWTELKRVVKEQRKAGNPIAMMIHDFHFEQNKITLLLTDNTDDAAEDDLTAPVEQVAVDISLSAFANARAYFDAKKKSAAKEDKTKAATQKAISSAQKKATQELKKEVPSGPTIKVMRKPYWFEKFNWFITTENFLVISGRDAQQNEILVKKYLRPGDLYIHADLHGASSCILKNPTGKVVPPVSLSQAGTMCVCRSSAWDSKIVTSAWWVYHNQVSKTAPTGEYLPTGSFMIRGRKNFLPPNALVMGLTILWKVAEECIPNHLQERRAPEQFQLNPYHLQTMADPLMRCGSMDGDGSGLRSVTLTVGDLVSEASPPPDDAYQQLEDFGSVSPGEASDDALPGRNDSGEREHTGEDEADEEEQPNEKHPGTLAKGVNTDFNRYGLHQMPYDPSLGQPPSLPSKPNGVATSTTIDQVAQTKEDSAEKSGKKRMSAKERRMLKQKQKNDKSNDPTQHSDDDDDDEEEVEQQQGKQRSRSSKSVDSNPASANESKKKEVAPTPPPSKIKKGKLKKMQKYADQDEEDRMLAMMLLGHKFKPKGDEVADTNKNDIKAQDPKSGKGQKTPATAPKGQKKDLTVDQPPPQATHQVHAAKSKTGSAFEGNGVHTPANEVTVEEEEETQNNISSKPSDLTGGPKADAKVADDVKQLLEDEGLKHIDDEERERIDLNELDALTGCPVDADTLLFAIPMCAPYSAIQSYKYKVKITPGPLKRGKAAQAIEKHFLSMKEAPEREKLLIRSIDHMDMIAAVVGNCRVSIPGVTEKGSSSKGHKGK